VTLGLALNNAISGLKINQQSIAVLSQNIANVNTVGYSRQILNQSAVTVEGVGSGVRLDEITRKIDQYLQRSVQSQGSTNATSQTLNTYYERIQEVLGRPGSGNSVDGFITSFFNSVQQLAEIPETSSIKANAIGSANALSKQLSDLAANVFDLRYEADSEISTGVNVVNAALDRLKNINAALNQAKSFGQSTSGLLDDRDKELRTISEYINISTTYNQSGGVSIVGGDGAALLEEGVRHQLRYTKAQSINVFVQDGSLSPLEVVSFNDSNEEVGFRVALISGGKSGDVVSSLPSGKFAGLQQIRDDKFPAILAQLDQLSSRIRDGVNAIHNNGSGFPPATSLTGERLVRASDQYNWAGSVRIGVLQPNGKPVASRYADEAFAGVRPLTLDLSRLDSGQGNGRPTLQTIVDEINNHFGSPGNKAKLGNLNNIQLASNSASLPSGAPPVFNFDLDLDNISSGTAKVFVTGVTVLDDAAANITNVTQTAPSVSILPANSYTTTFGSADVTINLASNPGFAVGDQIYLNPPSGPVNGIPAGSLTGFFTVTAVAGNAITFTAGAVAAVTGAVNDGGNIQAFAPYHQVAAGIKERTRDSGQLQVDFSGSPTSAYFDITLDVSVVDAAGVISSAPITYRVQNNVLNQFNKRFDVQSIGGAGTLVLPGDSQETLRAILVDVDGNEVPKVNGRYIETQSYLKIIGGNSGVAYGISIDELDSLQLGKPDGAPAEVGTNRGFSHYFGLNNFFAANGQTLTGEELRNSAYNFQVQDRLLANSNLISTGNLVKLEKSASTNNLDVYSYARYAGDNSVAQRLAGLNTDIVSFDAAGGLPVTQQSLQGYTSDLLGFVSQRSAEASENAASSQVLFDGFKNKSDAVSGVNLDEELANTVVFQNAYSATARIITTVNKMYDDLLQIV
jgi:flagellar hook-associated protein 1 FlgK